MMSAALAPGAAAIVLFGTFLVLFVLRVPVAFALGLACLPSLVLEPRLSPMMLFNETFKAYNSFILLAVPFYLLTANLMNVAGHRPAGAAVALDGGPLPRCARADQRAALGLLRRNLGLLHGGRGEPEQDLHRRAGEGGLWPLFFYRDHRGLGGAGGVIPPSILMIVWGGVISTSSVPCTSRVSFPDC